MAAELEDHTRLLKLMTQHETRYRIKQEKLGLLDKRQNKSAPTAVENPTLGSASCPTHADLGSSPI